MSYTGIIVTEDGESIDRESDGHTVEAAAIDIVGQYVREVGDYDAGTVDVWPTDKTRKEKVAFGWRWEKPAIELELI